MKNLVYGLLSLALLMASAAAPAMTAHPIGSITPLAGATDGTSSPESEPEQAPGADVRC